MDFLKKLWANQVFKTVVVTAVGGAVGAIAPMAAAGAIIFNAATGSAALTGAITAVAALYIKHPTADTPSPPKA